MSFAEGGSTINVVPAFGGAVRIIAEGNLGATWSPDGREIGYVDGDTLYAVSSSGDTLRAVASVPGGHSPDWSPDGSFIALAQGNADFVWATSAFGNIASSAIVVVRVATGETSQVTPAGGSMDMSPVWTPEGETLLFVSDREGSRDIYESRIDDRGRPIGEAQRLTVGADAHSLRIGANGLTMVYSAYTYSSNIWAYEIPRSGTISTRDGEPVTSENQILEYGDVSPDGEWLVFDTDRFGNQDIFKMPIDGGDEIQLTHDPANDFAPVWSPHGDEVAFYSMRHGTRDVFVMNADGSSLTRVTHDDMRQERYPRWSPDGNRLAYDGVGPATESPQVFIVTRSRRSEPWGEAVVFAPVAAYPSWSPDGRHIAYIRANSLVVTAVDRPGDILIVGSFALPSGSVMQDVDWSTDHQTIFFKTSDPAGGAIWGISDEAFREGANVLHRRYLVFDDALVLPRHTFRVRNNKFYVTLGEHESDIWVVDLE
jgi:Tol biopolymer transport system component